MALQLGEPITVIGAPKKHKVLHKIGTDIRGLQLVDLPIHNNRLSYAQHDDRNVKEVVRRVEEYRTNILNPLMVKPEPQKEINDPIKKFLKLNFVGIVINYVGKERGDFCYCPECGNYVLIKENYCPICDDGSELTLEFVYEADTELSEQIDFMHATAVELRRLGWVVIDVGEEFDYKGVTYRVEKAEFEMYYGKERTWIYVRNMQVGITTKFSLEFIANIFANFSRKKS